MEPAIESHDQLDLPDGPARLASYFLGRGSHGGQRPGLAVQRAKITAGASLTLLIVGRQVGNSNQGRLFARVLGVAQVEE